MEMAVNDNEIKQEVVAAYNEVLRKLKVTKLTEVDDNFTHQEPTDLSDQLELTEELTQLEVVDEKIAEEKARVIEVASSEGPDELVKNLSVLKQFLTKSLDEIKVRLLPEYEKYHTLRKAIALSENELKEIHDITANVNTFKALLLAQKQKSIEFENEMAESKRILMQEKLRIEKDRLQEAAEYNSKRELLRKADAEQYEMTNRRLNQEIVDRRLAFEEECEIREARLSARESEHQQVKEREAWIIAREQEYHQLKEKAALHPEELRAVQKAERAVSDNLIRKFEYDARLTQIELESERKMYQQKISALEDQINQYRNLKQMFNQVDHNERVMEEA
jgi:hypothetical protein